MTTSAGTYALDATARTLTFTPAAGWSGTSTLTYRLTDADGTATSTVSATVTAPALLAAQPVTSQARGTRTQTVPVTLPAGGSLKLLDGSGDPVPTLAVPAVGTFGVAGGDLTLAPVSGYTGDAAVGYRVTDAYGQTSDSTWTATVGGPQTSQGPTLTDSGVGTAPQHFTLPVPAGSTATLMDGQTGLPTSTWDNGVHGVWRQVGSQVTYTPALGLTGTRTASVHVTNEYGDVVEVQASADVAAPAAPVAAPATSHGTGEAPQQVTLSVPAGGAVDLLDAHGASTAQVVRPGVGTFLLSGNRVVFVPVAGYHGTAVQRYRVTDAYEQTGTGTYTATVTAPAAPTASDVKTTGPAGALQVQAVRVPIGGRLEPARRRRPPRPGAARPGSGRLLDPGHGRQRPVRPREGLLRHGDHGALPGHRRLRPVGRRDLHPLGAGRCGRRPDGERRPARPHRARRERHAARDRAGRPRPHRDGARRGHRHGRRSPSGDRQRHPLGRRCPHHGPGAVQRARQGALEPARRRLGDHPRHRPRTGRALDERRARRRPRRRPHRGACAPCTSPAARRRRPLPTPATCAPCARRWPRRPARSTSWATPTASRRRPTTSGSACSAPAPRRRPCSPAGTSLRTWSAGASRRRSPATRRPPGAP
ncbi:hypothetical protein GCM10025868_29970 [Angustibacter aerolatus]|uniref:CshA domain-containing protein n=1 Tax=Angustibacter aerolatus TaxID=1162965 RepID=A0ABQ6JHP3_9ACTN|nr:hypothetical protein [Angustibacter aerolatus]GMA87747.1 hypothetical protein GCM10025868_29970 [Angustibacter aerolatus]